MLVFLAYVLELSRCNFAKTLKKISPNLLRKLSKKMNINIEEGYVDVKEKVVFYKDKEGRLRRFDTVDSANKKYQ